MTTRVSPEPKSHVEIAYSTFAKVPKHELLNRLKDLAVTIGPIASPHSQLPPLSSFTVDAGFEKLAILFNTPITGQQLKYVLFHGLRQEFLAGLQRLSQDYDLSKHTEAIFETKALIKDVRNQLITLQFESMLRRRYPIHHVNEELPKYLLENDLTDFEAMLGQIELMASDSELFTMFAANYSHVYEMLDHLDNLIKTFLQSPLDEESVKSHLRDFLVSWETLLKNNLKVMLSNVAELNKLTT